ncbi:MAG: DUF559 domain-containing protein [Croceibacterium sp.]
MRKTDHAYAKARSLRREMSLPEGLLWRELRRKMAGFKVRRQHPVGPFVLDFYCAAAKLGIEIDGVSHDRGDRPAQDQSRDVFLNGQGITIVRIAASEVLRSPIEVAEAIVAVCRERGA